VKHLPAGLRTAVFALVAMAFLLAGFLAVVRWAQGGEVYGAYAAAISFIVASVAGKHATETLATGGGIAGAWRALTTDAKPKDPEVKP